MTMAEQLDKINQKLMSKNFKLTSQRKATVCVLLENESAHLSAEDVFMLVRERYPEIGLATVYRTLELLAELHIVEKMNFGDGVARFDLRGEGHDHMHHHLICTMCGSVAEIQDDWLVALEQKIKQEYGFKVTDHRLDLLGVYCKCRCLGCNKAGGKGCKEVC